MVNIDLHRSSLVNILREIYSDTLLRVSLGFKGGSAAMLFYGLPRFSVDLDFDLLDLGKKDSVFRRLKEMLPKFGEIVEASDKFHTLFFLLSYQKGERGLKVEISKRIMRTAYAPKNYLGISMLVMKEEDMISNKLAAFLTRKKFASRDLFDLWFFLKHNWRINEKTVLEHTNLSLSKALKKAQDQVKAVKATKLLAGLGELLENNKQKAWVKEKLKDELVFLLNLYRDNLKRRQK